MGFIFVFWNIIITVSKYFIYTWLYNCIISTELCITANAVHKKIYIPFFYKESTIPLKKITKVSTINIFWIFKAVIIHQYNTFPCIFLTWTNKEFKNELVKLITKTDGKIENNTEWKNLFNL